MELPNATPAMSMHSGIETCGFRVTGAAAHQFNCPSASETYAPEFGANQVKRMASAIAGAAFFIDLTDHGRQEPLRAEAIPGQTLVQFASC